MGIYASILYTILPTQFSKNQVDQAMKRGMNPKCGDLRNNPYIYIYIIGDMTNNVIFGSENWWIRKWHFIWNHDDEWIMNIWGILLLNKTHWELWSAHPECIECISALVGLNKRWQNSGWLWCRQSITELDDGKIGTGTPIFLMVKKPMGFRLRFSPTKQSIEFLRSLPCPWNPPFFSLSVVTRPHFLSATLPTRRIVFVSIWGSLQGWNGVAPLDQLQQAECISSLFSQTPLKDLLAVVGFLPTPMRVTSNSRFSSKWNTLVSPITHPQLVGLWHSHGCIYIYIYIHTYTYLCYIYIYICNIYIYKYVVSPAASWKSWWTTNCLKQRRRARSPRRPRRLSPRRRNPSCAWWEDSGVGTWLP